MIENDIWRIRTNQELYHLYKDPPIVTSIKKEDCAGQDMLEGCQSVEHQKLFTGRNQGADDSLVAQDWGGSMMWKRTYNSWGFGHGEGKPSIDPNGRMWWSRPGPYMGCSATDDDYESKLILTLELLMIMVL